MTDSAPTGFDPAAVRAAAARLQVLADAAEAHIRRARLSFGPAGAGRAHVGAGQALRESFDPTAASLRAWARAVAEIAAGLSSGAARYRAGDTVFAAGIARVG